MKRYFIKLLEFKIRVLHKVLDYVKGDKPLKISDKDWIKGYNKWKSHINKNDTE